MRKWMLLLCVALLMGCSTTPAQDDAQKEANVSYCESDVGGCPLGEASSEAADTSWMKRLSMQEAIAMVQEEQDSVIYFGYPDCPWCQEILPLLQEVATASQKDVYYVQTRDEAKELLYTNEEKEQFIPYLRAYMKQDDEGVYQLYVPLVIRIQDGKVSGGHLGSVDGHDAHERKMTDREKEEVKSIYQELLS